METARAYFDAAVFPRTDAFGLERSSLQLAWDFTTGSVGWALEDLIQVRDLTLAWLEDRAPTVTIESVFEETSGSSAVTVYGAITGPLVMEHKAPGALLARDDSGRVRLNGEASFPFTATIPRDLTERDGEGLALIYGHGFFGERVEVETSAARHIGNTTHSVMFAVDFQGMSLHDMGPVVANLGHETANALQFTDRVAQGMVNQLVLSRAVLEVLPLEEAFQRPTGAPFYNADELNYLGISAGHILGGVLAALSPDITNYCLNVGGAVFTHMMSRAIPFEQFLVVLAVSIPDPFEQQK